MKAVCIGYEGAEAVLKREVKERLGISAKTEPSIALLDADEKQLQKLAYSGQSFIHVIILLGSGNLKSFDDLEKIKLDKNLLEKYVKNKSFRTDCLRLGGHDFNSQDVEAKIGEIILDNVKCKVDLHKPDVKVFCYIFNDRCYLGIDIAGFELDKRYYKVYTGAKSINSVFGFNLLMLGSYKKGQILLDPFCDCGTIPIEAAYYSSDAPVHEQQKEKFKFKINQKETKTNKKQTKQIFAFDPQVRNVTACRHNCKIGKVDSYIDMSKVTTDWLDTKFDKEHVDLVATIAPQPTKLTLKKIKKVYPILFDRLEIILKKKGTFITIGNKLLEEFGKKSKLKLEKKIKIRKGNQIFELFVYRK
jgi:23S rRNA G2445 N2-methylase RlmL